MPAGPAPDRSPLGDALELLAGTLETPQDESAPELLSRFLAALLPEFPGARGAVLCSWDGAELASAGDLALGRHAAVTAVPLPGGGTLRLVGDGPRGPDPVGHPIAAACAVACRALALRTRVANLEVGLSSSRQIAAAVGIVMAQRRCSYDEAFDRLRAASQRTHRKVRELADEVLFTGALPDAGADDALAG